MKLNKLFYLLAVVGAIFVSCGNDNDITPKPNNGNGNGGDTTTTLEVEQQSVEVAFYGGEGAIDYTIVGGNGNQKPTASCSYNWVSNIAVGSKITFKVAHNTTESARIATIRLTYGEQTIDVYVRQDAGWKADYEFTATALNGEYYGMKFGDPNYFVILSRYGVTGSMSYGADTYYRLDMISKIAAGSTITLPHGIYTFDMYDLGVGDTFGYGYSYFLDVLDTGAWYETHFEDGAIFVTENKIEAWLKLIGGQVHHVVYEGSLELAYNKIPTPDYYSTLTEDYAVNETGGELRLVNYGDTFGIGANQWSVSMADSSSNNYNYFMLNVVAEGTSSNIDSILGTYSVATDANNPTKKTYIAGSKDGNLFTGSWYFEVVEGGFGQYGQAPLTGGTITIEKDGATGYKVIYDCVDDNGHKITGTYACAFATDYSSQQ